MMQRFTWPQSPRRPRRPSSVDSSDFSSSPTTAQLFYFAYFIRNCFDCFVYVLHGLQHKIGASFASEASEEGQEVSGLTLVNTDSGSSFQYQPSLSVRSRLINHPNLIRNPTRVDYLSYLTERKKIVLKLDFDGDKAKRKAIMAVSTIPGIDSIAVDMKDMKVRKLTVIGSIDPIYLVRKLRKLWHTDLLTLGPAKEPVKKEEPKEEEEAKKEEPKKEEPKKEEAKKEEPKEELEKKNEEPRMGINVANP